MAGKFDGREQTIAAEQLAKEKAYWTGKLSGEFKKSGFRPDYCNNGPLRHQSQKACVVFSFSGELFDRLNILSSGSDPNLHVVLTAGLAVLLAKYSGNTDFIVGTSIDRQEGQRALINTVLPLRIRFIPGMTFKALLLAVREIVNEAIENRNYPIETLALQMDLPASRGEFPLFDVSVLLENIQDPQYLQHIEHPMCFSFLRSGSVIQGKVTYRAHLYERQGIERLAAHLKTLLGHLLFHVDREIEHTNLLLEDEKKQLEDFNQTVVDEPFESVRRLFERGVQRHPDKIALEEVESHRCVTYRELHCRSNGLAGRLRTMGAAAGSIVALVMEPSLEAVTAILGIMKTGAAYLPIDPDSPGERIDSILADSGAAILLREKDIDGKSASNPPYTIQPADPAYIIYTSGSTGRPKGVMVEHRSLANYIRWAAKTYVKNETVNFPLFTSVAFDLTATSIFTPLTTGNSTAVYGNWARGNLIERIIDDNRVGVIKLTPSHLKLIREKKPGHSSCSPRRFILGGEKLSTRLAAEIYRNFKGEIEIYNEYGPTEATVGCMLHRFSPSGDKNSFVPIGTPAENCRIYLLDRGLNQVPPGAVGEIYISGTGLARGYVNRPLLTAEKFIWTPDPAAGAKQVRLYKTGDLALWVTGEPAKIEFLGRTDQQVKVRGFRIELGEIENRLLQHENIKEAVVVVRDFPGPGSQAGGEPCLCAYIVSNNGDIPSLKEYLLKRLPHYMLPSYFVPVEELRLTPHGKIDLKALPRPREIDEGVKYQPPTTEMEQLLVEIWQDVLGLERVGINDGYLSSGGDSIKAIQVAARLQKFRLKLELQDLFKYSTIKELAGCLKSTRLTAPQGIIQGEIKLTPIQAWFFEKNFRDKHHFNQSVVLYGTRGFKEDVLEAALQKLLEHHDALRMIFREQGDKINQYNRGRDGNKPDMQVFDISEEEDVEKVIRDTCGRLQRSIDLNAGPLVKVGLFKTGKGDYLAIAIHHLVIDGVSWRILFEDFASFYKQVEIGRLGANMDIPLKTTPYKEWAEQLALYANSPRLLEEIPYWKKLEQTVVLPIPDRGVKQADQPGPRTEKSLCLSRQYTEKLLTDVHKAYNTEINDILLTALGLALSRCFGRDKLAVDLEGHGREEIIDGVDVSRTVGWFTSVYPVVLDMTGADDPGTVIKNTKEMLRRIPNKGIGYGILKYLTAPDNKQGLEFTLKPGIGFNYLGQFDRDASTDLFQPTDIQTGDAVSPGSGNIYPLYFIGSVFKRQLTMSVVYKAGEYDETVISRLVKGFDWELRQIIDHCAAREGTELTLSDFSTSLEEQDVEAVFAALSTTPGLKTDEVQDMYALSPMQEGMLFHYMMEPSSTVYFEQTGYRLDGEIDHRLVEQAFNRLVERYDVFRTLFVYENTSRPIQVVLKKRSASVDYRDVTHLNLSGEEREAFVREVKIKDRQKNFDLARDIPVRFRVLQLGGGQVEIIWSFHHIIMDGWCVGILLKELLTIYRCLKEGKPPVLPAISPYSLYIKWLEKQHREQGEQYWREYLGDIENQSGIPKIHEKPADQFEQETIDFTVNRDLTAALEGIARENQVTISTVFHALWGILLRNYNQDCSEAGDVVFGTVIANRPPEIPGIETMIGLFINTVPLRVQAGPGKGFNTLLKELQEDMNRSKINGYLPLADIQSLSPLKNRLVNHIIVFENYPLEKELENINEQNRLGFSVRQVEAYARTNYDMTVLVVPGPGLTVKIKYNRGVYDAHLIGAIENHLTRVIKQVLHRPYMPADRVEILSQPEKKQLLVEFNRTAAPYPVGQGIHELFARQVEKNPGHVALVGPRPPDGEAALTYRELNEASGQLAHVLKEKGVTADVIVGLTVERTLDMIIGILGILKANGAYLPIDPAYPRERIRYMLKDSGAKILVIDPGLSGKFKKLSIVNCQLLTVNEKEHPPFRQRQDNPPKEANAINNYQLTINNLQLKTNCLAYIIYTSGTTGKPKGVSISHENLVNYVNWFGKTVELSGKDRSILTSSFAFDLGYTSIFPPLAGGGQLHIIPEETYLDPGGLIERMARNRITYIKVTPSLFSVMVESDYFTGERCRRLRLVVLGGEEIKTGDMKKAGMICRHLQFMNHYGPSEATIGSITYLLPDGRLEDYGKRPFIGKPIYNTRVYILDRRSRPVPAGVPGELCLSGAGLTRGYLNRPGLTAEKFDHDIWDLWNAGYKKQKSPAMNNNRSYRSHMSYIYHTGDLARWMWNGNIEFLGRMDNQVKIRGFRIELAEIENQLRDNPSVEKAVVMTRETGKGDKYICAYIVPHEPVTANELVDYLSGKLPAYMIPTRFVQLGAIPLTPNGKVDWKRLPGPEDGSRERENRRRSPRNKTEAALMALWAEVLEIDKEEIGIDTDFFRAGGHSLKAMKLITKIHKKFQVSIPLKEIFNRPTIETFSTCLTGGEEDSYSSIAPVEKKEYYVLSPAQKRLYVWQQMEKENPGYNTPRILRLEGAVDREKVEWTFRCLISRHESLRTSFKMVKGEPVQVIHDSPGFKMEYKDLSAGEVGQPDVDGIVEEFIRPFDLSRAPLMRVGLVKTAKEEYLLMMDIHHIVSDALSKTILEKEFIMLYQGGEPPARSFVRYKDFAQWQSRWLHSPQMKKQEAYWLRVFEKDLPPTELPYDFQEKTILHSYKGTTIYFELDGAVTAALKELALQEDATLYLVLLAAYNIFLSKISGRQDILVGTPVAGRRHADLENLMGLFVNTLMLRNYPSPGQSFKKFLAEIKENTLEAFDNQDYPLDLLIDRVKDSREVRPTAFVLHNPVLDSTNIPGVILKLHPIIKKPLKVEITLQAMEVADKIHCSFEYCIRLFKKETIQRFIKYFREIISTILENREIKLGDITLSHGLIRLDQPVPKVEFDF